MLFTLIKNEIFKTFKRPKTKVVTILFILFTCLMVWVNHYAEIQEAKYNDPKTKIESLKNQKEYLETDTKVSAEKLEGAEKEQYLQSQEAQKKSIDEQIALYEKQLSAGNDEEKWKADLDAQILNIKSKINDKTIQERYKDSLNKQLDELQYYKDNNLKPLAETYLNGSNFITMLMQILGQIFLVVGLAVFMSDIVSGECTPATMKFLLIQPIKKGKVLLSKFIAIVISSIALIIPIEAIVMGGVSLFRGFGYANLPVQIAQKYMVDLSSGDKQLIQVAGSGHTVEQWKMIALAFLLQALFILAVCSFVFMISSLVKSSMISMAISTLTLVIIPVLFQMISSIRKWAHLVFTTYASPIDILNGSSIMQFSNINITAQNSIIVLLVTSVVSYIIAHVVFTKKDLLV